MIVISSGKRSIFICNNHWSRGNAICTNKVRIKHRDLEKAVVETLSGRLLNPGAIENIYARANQYPKGMITGSSEDETSLQKELIHENKQLDNLVRFEMGGDVSEAIREQIRIKEAHIKSLQRKIKELYGKFTTKLIIIKENVEKLKNLRNLVLEPKQSHTLVQLELKRLPKEKIVLEPEDMGQYYSIKGVIKVNLNYLFN